MFEDLLFLNFITNTPDYKHMSVAISSMHCYAQLERVVRLDMLSNNGRV